MNPKERILTTLDHTEPDRVPLTAQFWQDTEIKLMKYFKIQSKDQLYSKLGIEIDRINLKVEPLSNWNPTKDYLDFCNMIGYNTREQYVTYEEWGIRRKLGSVRPGSEIRQFYFTKHPWEDFTEIEQVQDVQLPKLEAFGRFDTATKLARKFKEELLIVGDIGHCQWTKAWELRGMLTLMKDLHTRPKMAEAILDKLLNYYLDMTDRFLDIGVEAIRYSEDWANNKSMFINPDMWRRLFKPRYKKLFQRAKRKGAFIFFHSDGNIRPIVDDLVEIGIDLLNPVQPECMNRIEIKKKFGDLITLDTGSSVQRTLPHGTVDEVKNETLNAFKHLAPGGGFIYGTSHMAMYDVPVENILTLYDTCRKYGKYPIQIP
jgi:uroporphyrinogen decarboxylase